MFIELKDANYISSYDFSKNDVRSTWKLFDYEMMRFFSTEERKEYNKMLNKYEKTEDLVQKEIMKNEIRKYLENMIKIKNETYIEEKDPENSNERIGINHFHDLLPPLFSHKLPKHITNGLIVDMIIGWNAKKVYSRRLDCGLEDTFGHYPCLTTIK
jgi:hypothetical protein